MSKGTVEVIKGLNPQPSVSQSTKYFSTANISLFRLFASICFHTYFILWGSEHNRQHDGK